MDRDNKTAAALGMFDGVHIGHIGVINSVLGQVNRGRQENLSPAVFTFRTLYKSGGSILPYKMKFDMLKAAGVKTVYSSDFESVRDLSAEEFVRRILIGKMNCKHVSCGWNFRFSKNAGADSEDLRRICSKHGIEVCIVPPVEVDGAAVSSTRIRTAIRGGDISSANRMLGYDLTYELEVVEGAKLGRTLGFPTINQIIPELCVLPKFGVYKSRVLIDKVTYNGVTNIGVKPTVDNNLTPLPLPLPLIETHVPGFNTDIYGQTVRVSLLEFIREEKKFSSTHELKSQICADVAGVKEICKQ